MLDIADLTFRAARREDLRAIVDMLIDDPLGSQRESGDIGELDAAYVAAFESIDADPNHVLLVAATASPVAVLQLSFLPNLTYQGGWRAQIEGVRVHNASRGKGVGGALIREAIRRADERGCRLMQLTTDKQRPDALRFYEQLGFSASHEGMKLHLGR